MLQSSHWELGCRISHLLRGTRDACTRIKTGRNGEIGNENANEECDGEAECTAIHTGTETMASIDERKWVIDDIDGNSGITIKMGVVIRAGSASIFNSMRDKLERGAPVTRRFFLS